MVSLNASLQTAVRGMNVSQLGLSTISHNLANANTDGYSRQEVQFSSVSYNGFGAGVELESITRYADKFLNSRILDHQSDAAYNNTRTNYLSNMEGLFAANGTSASIDRQLNTFFNGLSDLANAPDSDAQQTVVLQNATLLTDTLNNMSDELTQTKNLLDGKLDEEIAIINTLLKNIDELNTEIATQSAGQVNGASTNDLEDERQRQIDALAERFGISVATSAATNSVRITSESGRTLVHEGGYVQLERTTGTPYEGIGTRAISVGGEAPNVVDIDVARLSTGSVKALLDVRDTDVANLEASLDKLATTLMREVNSLHSQGSSFPAQSTLTSGSTNGVSNTTADLFTELSADLAGDTFHVSIVTTGGAPVSTTVGSAPITIPSVGPFSLTDLQDLINNNADVGVTALGAGLGATATATTDSNGNSVISISATNANYKIVLSNAADSVTNNPLGVLGMNNFFTGTGATDIDVRSDIKANGNLMATARMRDTDGGLSSLDNQNMLALAGLADAETAFLAAGNLSAQTDTITGYALRITADLALTTADSSTRADFSQAMLGEVEAEIASLTGVNMDEELAQMLVYQTAFQASARMMSTIDEMLQYLFNNL